MRKRHIYMLIAILTVVGLKANAQKKARIPEASPSQTIIQDFGLGKIAITYSRPAVKGRVIFGGINPYGQVWRTGANDATTITFTENVIVEGNKVPAGTYSLFTIPEKNEWTVILNKTAKQWGAYSYKEADDLLRFKVKPVYLAEKRESFTIQFANETTQSSDLHMVWDHTAIYVHLHTDDDAQIMTNIDELMSGNRKPYYIIAIQYYYDNHKDMKKALEWALEAEKTDPKGPWFKLWEARIHLRLGDKTSAKAAAQAGIELAKASNDEEYVRLNQEVLNQANS